MSKILLVEPSKMLQHAFVLALFPEHEVEIIDDIERGTSGAKPDLAIIDARVVRDHRADKLRETRQWPTIRIGVAAGGGPSSSEPIVLSMPFTKEELRAAIMRALGSAPTNTAARVEDASRDTPSPRRAKAATATANKQQDAKDRPVIELVDVFQDEDLDGRAQR